MIPTKYQFPFQDFLERETGTFHLYHDETLPERPRGTAVGHPVTGHGVLYVPTEARNALAAQLMAARNGFDDEIHFVNVKAASKHSKLFLAAQRWIQLFFDELNTQECSFKATLALHAGPLHVPYADEEQWPKHLVRSTSHTIVGLTRFTRSRYDALHITPIFDATDNLVHRGLYQRGVDFFARRSNRRRDAGNRKYPYIRTVPIEYRSSNPADATGMEERIDAEFLQLTDLLLGSAEQALGLRAGMNDGRLALADNLAQLMAQTWGAPAYRYGQRARSFSVTLWPDRFGLPYAAVPVRKQARRVPQIPLPGSSEWELRGLLAPWPGSTGTVVTTSANTAPPAPQSPPPS